jgi:hypothetical protein
MNSEAKLNCNIDKYINAEEINVQEFIDSKILFDNYLKNAGMFESKCNFNENGIIQYESNLFDFIDVDYEHIELNAKSIINQLELTYDNVCGYTVGKYEAGNSFGIKLVINIFTKDLYLYEGVVTDYPDYYLGMGTPGEFWTLDTWCEIDKSQTNDTEIWFYFEELNGSSFLRIIDNSNQEPISNVKEFIGDATHIRINSGGGFSLKSTK